MAQFRSAWEMSMRASVFWRKLMHRPTTPHTLASCSARRSWHVAQSGFQRAIEVFSSAKLAHLDRELIDPIVVSATRAMHSGEALRGIRTSSRGQRSQARR